MRNNQRIKWISMSTLLALLLLGAGGESIKADLYVNDTLVKSFTSYQVIDDTVFLPLGEAAAALGVKGYADASTQTVYLQWDQDLIVVSTEQRSARRGGEIIPLKFTPIWTPREVYVPHQVFTEVLAKAKGESIRAVHPAIAGAAPDSTRPAPAPAASGLRNPVDVIVLDPGHGGHDSGAKGPGGLLEKDVALAIAQKLQARLQREPGLSAPMTRDGDTFIPLAERPDKARRLHADLFVSIHANAARYISAQGFETFFASPSASDQAAFDLARLENQEQAAPAGPDPVRSDLESILGSMAQSEHLSESQHIAELVQRELAGALASDDRGVKQAPFRVLMDSTTPAILVEVGFISSPREARTITDPEVQDRIVAAVARALCRYRDETNQRLGLAPKG